ncbi:hypothetical protein D3C86_1674640 [compost metagenome]
MSCAKALFVKAANPKGIDAIARFFPIFPNCVKLSLLEPVLFIKLSSVKDSINFKIFIISNF